MSPIVYLDAAYRSLMAFVADCTRCGADAGELLRIGAYVRCNDGYIVACDYVEL